MQDELYGSLILLGLCIVAALTIWISSGAYRVAQIIVEVLKRKLEKASDAFSGFVLRNLLALIIVGIFALFALVDLIYRLLPYFFALKFLELFR